MWVLFAVLAVCIGMYPGIYFITDRNFGLLSSKDSDLLLNPFWNIGFYTHIILGGISLLIGWTQFSPKLRDKNLNIHRQIGKAYIISALLSAMAGLYIAFYATGGLISILGFSLLGFIWFSSSLAGFLVIKKGNTIDHERFMIYSYACCFAAVTLRIWLPLLIIAFNDFLPAYRVVAWLCWVPNLIAAFFIIRSINKKENKVIKLV